MCTGAENNPNSVVGHRKREFKERDEEIIIRARTARSNYVSYG
jgi:hypothetical protein